MFASQRAFAFKPEEPVYIREAIQYTQKEFLDILLIKSIKLRCYHTQLLLERHQPLPHRLGGEKILEHTVKVTGITKIDQPGWNISWFGLLVRSEVFFHYMTLDAAEFRFLMTGPIVQSPCFLGFHGFVAHLPNFVLLQAFKSALGTANSSNAPANSKNVTALKPAW